ncbi:hypothetical protein DMC30DRAFT_417438 [Rhodotorula diobovata]|uniref:Uncharacterized protein n=1 Tax=Rhodotorula diobovata TaxID=5288 RepID=A0A5C5FTI9_9BASI|nr:hypothetical protein DMC30DRAFT_417438 [Rhodotorula diobovata]
MDDTVKLRTSDDPYVKLKPLAPATQAARASTWQQPKDELEPFLCVLNIAHDRGDPVDEPKEDQWPDVARLANKKWARKADGDPDNGDFDDLSAFETAGLLGEGLRKWRTPFDQWMHELELHALRLTTRPPGVTQYMAAWEPSKAAHPFSGRLQAAVKHWPFCLRCMTHFYDCRIRRIEAEYRHTAPGLPL